MNKMCTTIEQSKKLIELGIDTDTADMCYKCIVEDPYDLIVRPYSDWKEEYKVLLRSGDAKVYPAWSLAALFSVIPEGLIENYYIPNIQKENGKYSIAYGDEELLCEADNPVDACYKMIIKLKEKGLL